MNQILSPLREGEQKAIADRSFKLRESNRKLIERDWKEKTYDPMLAQILESFRIDIEDESVKEVIDITSPGWSIKAFRESVYDHCRKVREANAEGALGALLRAGAVTSTNNMYNSVPVEWEGLAQVVPSNKAVELYNPLFRAGFPSRTNEGEEPRRLKAKGQDILIRNYKDAAIFEVTEEMMDDDLSNQIADQPRQIGENGAIVKDAWFFQRWLGTAGTDPGGDIIPASQTGTQAGESAAWPYSSTGFTNGGGKNKLASLLAFGQAGLQQAQQLAFAMLDAKGQRMLINLDTLIAGSALADPVALLLNSLYYPASGTMHAATSGGGDTGLGVQFATNVFKGRYNPVISRWLPATSYGLMQAGKGIVMQNRRPPRLIQESPISGPAFSMSVLRWKWDERWETDWIEPRFSILCSDGSV